MSKFLVFCRRRIALTASIAMLVVSDANADIVIKWNETSADIVVSAVKSPAMANHMLAMVQSAVYEAVNSISGKYPSTVLPSVSQSGASIDAAVASANHTMLMDILPKSQAQVTAAFDSALMQISDGDAKAQGILVGQQAAEAVIAWRKSLKPAKSEPYRPITQPGVYIPTSPLAGPSWGKRATWILTSSDELRPPPPPALDSAEWARDFNEVKAFGEKDSADRSADQTQAALFWQATAPTIYYPVLRSVAEVAGRDVTQNARLLAVAGRAMDDALVAVFEAKYHYHFWRPVTAIRNGDQDASQATDRKADWVPLISTPPHPEYPCAHCVVSGAIAGVLQAELEGMPAPLLSTTSPALPGVQRSWTSIDEFAQEVADARIYDGVHYRTSADIGTALGKQIGMMSMEKAMNP